MAIKKIVLISGVLTASLAARAQAQSVRDWWNQCNGNTSKSTCLTDSELDKFKLICTDKSFKKDCQSVVEYSVARARVLEAKALLLEGHAAQLLNFAAGHIYLNNVDKIWSENSIDKASSFAVGLLPSCAAKTGKKLLFGEKLRFEREEFKKKVLKQYNQLNSLACSSSEKGFTLVAIGKVLDEVNEFEIYTIDENKKLTVMRTVLGRGPFFSD